ncbi:unnamed protein product [Paramecium sonneborni]|uniref:Uncharacterized protein n=1 Tax=Paramecium sonneborni TaxID=65129 RepID=A0A8S1R1N5_9CILI|nr:unnamed protein product [Paramecium sonneborni]
MDTNYSIIITNYDDYSNVPYEKIFNPQTSIQKVLEEFQLDDAYIINHEKKIIQPQTKLSELKQTEENKILFQKQSNNEEVLKDCVRIKYYTKEQESNQCQIIWEIQQSLYPPIVYFSLQKGFRCIIHKNKKIQNCDLLFQNLKNNENENEVLEFSVLNNDLQEDEILVIIFSNQMRNQVGSYQWKFNRNIIINHQNQQNQIFEIEEQILYFGVEKRSATVKSILDKLNKQNQIAFQSGKGSLDPQQTLNHYFKTELQCKLLIIENIYQPLIIQQQDMMIVVNIIQNGQLLMRKQFDQSTKKDQIENSLLNEKKIKGLGLIDFYFDDNLISDYDSLGDLIFDNKKEINLEIFDRYTDLDQMEDFVLNTLNEIREAKKKQQKNEQGSVNLIYKKIIQPERIVNRICKIIEKQKYNNKQQDSLLVVLNGCEQSNLIK